MKSIYEIKTYIVAILIFVTSSCFAKQDIVLADDGKAGDAFGYDVAIDGGTILVGAFKADIDDEVDPGAAYVYIRNEGGWQKQAKLIAKPAFAGDTLGGKVSLNKDVAMLGAMRRDDKGKDSGAVVFFERELNNWVQRQIFYAPDAKPGDAFGQSIALTESHLVIGAPRNDALAEDSGAIYIYKRENDMWRYSTKVTASDGAAGDLFGISVAIDGDTVLVGADLNDEKAENAGAVYVYVLEDNNWTQQAKLMASDGGVTDIFGVRVALHANTALISARRDDTEEHGIDAGSAYVFVRDGGVWTEQMKLTSPDGQADDRFGRAVALTQDTAIISAMNHDANGKDTGAVYVYKYNPAGWRYDSKFMAESKMPNDNFGWNVGLSEGVVVVGTPNHDAKGQESGAVFIQKLNTKTK